ncbi:MAG: O-antigen ligase family protein [Beijerinckiaceae bacterium]
MTSATVHELDAVPRPGARNRAFASYAVSGRNFLFLLAVVLLNYTLMRPSPVDVSFTLALLASIFCNQRFTASTLVFLTLVFVWTFGLYSSSMPYAGDEDVALQLFKITYAISIGVCASLVVAHWNKDNLERFVRVWILSAMIATTLGAIGFATGSSALTWDGRAKGFFDDPNMYGAFLIPAVLGSLYFFNSGRNVRLYGGCFLYLVLGLLLSFSRVAVVAGLALCLAFVFIVNRKAMFKTVISLFGGLFAVMILAALAGVLMEGFDDKVLDRLTLAKEYDLGEQGRLHRYVLSFDLMMQKPQGLGTLQFALKFPEPIHNIWLSSFMNYGWAAGVAWCYLILFGVVKNIRSYRLTDDPIFLLLMFSWLGIVLCASLHEAERWRHLWLFTGLIWVLSVKNLEDRRTGA